VGRRKQLKQADFLTGIRRMVGRFFRPARLPLLLIVAALVPRLLSLVGMETSPLFNFPVIDSQFYHQRAVEIISGDFMGSSTFWQAPLYSYFLAVIYWIFGVKIIIARIIGLLLGAISCYLIFSLAEKIVGRKIAWLAYAISVLYGPFIFFDAELLAPALLNFLVLLALNIMSAYQTKPKTYKIFLVGLFLGLAQITHGLIIVFLPFLYGWMDYISRRRGEKIAITLKNFGVMLIGFLFAILLTTLHNYEVDNEFVPVSSNFGANFYLGNHPNYDSTTTIRPGMEWDEFIGEAAINGFQTPAQSSEFFTSRALHNITSDIPGYFGLLAKKFYLLLSGEEIKRNLDIYYFKHYSYLTNILIWKWFLKFPSGLVIPLALCGILIAFLNIGFARDKFDVWLILLFLISQTIAILLFFVSTRYRLVLMPFAIILAAGALWQLYYWIKEKKQRHTIIFGSVFVIFLIFCNIPRMETTPRDKAEDFFYEGQALADSGDYKAAIEKYKAAVGQEPYFMMARFDQAMAESHLGQTQLAQAILDKIVEKTPNSFVTHLIIGSAFLDFGQDGKAEKLFERVLQLNPNSVEAYINLGHIYRIRKNYDRALEYLNKALVLNPRAYKAYNQIGAVYFEQKKMATAEKYFLKAYDINKSYIAAINNLATVYVPTGQVDKAEAVLRRALILAPDDPDVLLNYGAVMMQEGKMQEALHYFDRAAELAPYKPEAQHLRGLVFMKMHQRREAIAAFKAALKANPKFEPSRKALKELGL
jgi:tetratricopeptide (TPR) repeat protein/4-amino-4-deoxy-L-arabinose transferase-like glycosyltransferase